MAKKKAKSKAKARPKTKRSAARPKAKPARKGAARKAPAQRRPAAAAARPSRAKGLGPGAQWVNPVLTVRNMPAAIDFYQRAFGFIVRNAMKAPDGTMVHAELLHKDSLIMLGPENPQTGNFAPQGPSPVTLYVFVEDVDRIVKQAESVGGRVMMPVADMFWGDRCGHVVDPEGHSWMIATHLREVAVDEMMKAMASTPPTM